LESNVDIFKEVLKPLVHDPILEARGLDVPLDGENFPPQKHAKRNLDCK
jgi:hypothetical protein